MTTPVTQNELIEKVEAASAITDHIEYDVTNQRVRITDQANTVPYNKQVTLGIGATDGSSAVTVGAGAGGNPYGISIGRSAGSAGATGNNLVSIGNNSNSTSLAYGIGGTNSVALGAYSATPGANAIAIGTYTVSESDGGIALGELSHIYPNSYYSMALGNSAYSYNIYNIQLGNGRNYDANTLNIGLGNGNNGGGPAYQYSMQYRMLDWDGLIPKGRLSRLNVTDLLSTSSSVSVDAPWNFIITGRPKFEGDIVSGFTKASYIELKEPFNPGTQYWEVGLKFNTGAALAVPQYLFNSKVESSMAGITLYFNPGTVALELYISTNGSTNTVSAISSTALAANTDYWVKLGWNGRAYSIQLSTDGVEYATIATAASTTNVTTSLTHTYLGCGFYQGAPSYPSRFSFDLDSIYTRHTTGTYGPNIGGPFVTWRPKKDKGTISTSLASLAGAGEDISFTPGVLNVNKVGSTVDIDSNFVASTFSQNSYLASTTNIWSQIANAGGFEFNIKFRLSTTSGISWLALMPVDNNYSTAFQLYATNGGGLYCGLTSRNDSGTTTSGTITVASGALTAGTDYWVRVKYTPASYLTLSLSSNGTTYTQVGQYNLGGVGVATSPLTAFLLGNTSGTYNTYYCKGSIDLTQTNIKLNDEIVWKAVDTDKVSINSTAIPDQKGNANKGLLTNGSSTYWNKVATDLDDIATAGDNVTFARGKKNYSITGHVVVDNNVASVFSATDYIRANHSPFYQATSVSSFEIGAKVNRGSSGGTILFQEWAANTSSIWLMAQTNGVLYILVRDPVANMTHAPQFVGALPANTNVWIKVCGKIGEPITAYSSTDGTTYTQLTPASTVNPLQGLSPFTDVMQVGVSTMTNSPTPMASPSSLIDLKEMYVKINDNLAWKAYDTSIQSISADVDSFEDMAEPGDNIVFTRSTTPEYSIVGSGVTVTDGVASGFTSSSWVQANTSPFYANTAPLTSFEIVSKATWISGSCIFLSQSRTGDTSGIINIYTIASGGPLVIDIKNGNDQWLSAGGSSVFTSNTPVWFKVSWAAGENIKIYKSTDGETYTQAGQSSSVVDSILPTIGTIFSVGSSVTGASPLTGGAIDLNETYVKINGVEVWRPYKAVGKTKIDTGDKVLVNKALNDTAISIMGTAASSTAAGAVNIGAASNAAGYSVSVGNNAGCGSNGVAIGVSAKASVGNGIHCVAVGASAQTSQGVSRATCLGANAKAQANQAIQIGYGTNTTASTLSVGFYDASNPTNWQLLDGITGNIPEARLGNTLLTGATAPSTTTVGTLGQLYKDTVTGIIYKCSVIDTTDPQNPVYKWRALIENLTTGTGSYAIGGSTANSQGVDALNAVVIGNGAVAVSQYATAVGDSARATGNSTTAIGRNTSAGGGQSTAIGYGAKVATSKTYAIQIGYGTNSESSTFSVGLSNTSGSNYKLLDADGTIPGPRMSLQAAGAPTTSTAGTVGQFYVDTTNEDAYICVSDASSTYTWKKITP